METIEIEEQAEGQGATNGHASWTSAMSSFMLSHLSNVVASGARTSSGFKKVHYNTCARAVNEKFATALTGEQIKNHLKTWSRRFAKINRLRKTHKADAEFLNKPLEHFAEMQTIFGNNMATGKFAKDSSAALGTEDVDTENTENEEVTAHAFTEGPAPCDDHVATSSASRPNKKAKIREAEEEGLVGAFKSVGKMLASAIQKVATGDNDVPDDLFDNLLTLPGFDQTHICFYYNHLVVNPHIASAFNKLPFVYKLTWVSAFISEKFPSK